MIRVPLRPLAHILAVRSSGGNPDDIEKQIVSLEKQMFEQAKNLAFEEAAGLRDQIEELRQQFVRS